MVAERRATVFKHIEGRASYEKSSLSNQVM
jgi:hypothetical protein